MPNFDIPKDLQDAIQRFQAEPVISSTVVEVEVLTDRTILDKFVTRVWDELNQIWAFSHQMSPLPVSEEELFRYFITAINTRVTYVNRGRSIVAFNDMWALPAPFAFVVNGLGTVNYESPALRVQPYWNDEWDEHVLSYPEWIDLSTRIRAIAADPYSRIILIEKLDRDKHGDERLMGLFPIRTEDGRLKDLRSRSEAKIEPVAAAAYLILGLEPKGWRDVVLNDHPFLTKPYQFPTELIEFILPHISRMGYARS